MKKILIAFFPDVAPWDVITFAIKFAKQNSAAIHAVYLSEKRDRINSDYPFPNDLSMAEDLSKEKDILEGNNQLIDDNLKVFKKECELNGVIFSIEKNISIKKLIDQTVNFDLLIGDAGIDFMARVLTNIHCPALITSTDKMPQKVALMYDNSASAKLAIETYISLFPEFSNLPTQLLSINPNQEDEFEMHRYFKEKLQPHFSNIMFQIEKGNKKNELENFLDQIPGQVLVVMGAFGRSALSVFFHPSFGKSVLKRRDISLFIAHDK
jgi:nucleotide-binding universal stress UspA family protein